MFIGVLILLAVSVAASLAGLFLPVVICSPIAAVCALAAGALTFLRRRTLLSTSYDRIDGVRLDLHRGEEKSEAISLDTAENHEEENVREEPEPLPEASAAIDEERAELNRKLSEISHTVLETVPQEIPRPRPIREAADNLASYADQSRDIVFRLEEQIGELSRIDVGRETSSSSRVQLRGKNRGSKELRELVTSLEELADRSNILAINAAIEAARIGKEGKGFAVIAGEMQSFSAQTVELARGLEMFRDHEAASNEEASDAGTAHMVKSKAIQETCERVRRIAADAAQTLRDLSGLPGIDGALRLLEECEKAEVETRDLAEGLKRLRSIAAGADSIE